MTMKMYALNAFLNKEPISMPLPGFKVNIAQC
jgi:hypothetical protein